MQQFEYKVVPAPVRGDKVKGVKGIQARFAHALASLMNEMGREGWEYQRADTLPCEERQGLTGKTTTFQNMLIFRRALPQQQVQAAPPVPVTPEEIAAIASASLRADAPEGVAPKIEQATPGPAPVIGPAARTDGMAAE
ncbi:DUF4177 domain-containing protein [Actibacterium sp. D379-3]